ncbi:MAG: alanine--tRNA ligase [Acidimicrobiia bacterium]|nr:alanine--tRNA ligase [Acidimicrobiia bacterium]
MTANEIRHSFLAYFERHGHRVVPSSPLVPHDDATLLFTNAGMNQFKDVFLGRDRRAYSRAASAQKCMRVSGKHNDLDNVGPSLRHHTFFEMLGNFSFGGYFKAEAIPFAWTLLTAEWKLPPDRLFATVFRGDDLVPADEEAYAIWRAHLPADHIERLGAADNFWQMGDTGPCGRCSEIYYFRGADLPCAEEAAGRPCGGVECRCDRFVEIWNNVFMEFDRQPDGSLQPLPAPSIDTGMGLERVTAVLQGTLSNYDTDLFTPLLAAVGDRVGAAHRGSMDPPDVSMRVIADHMRATTFLIADGVVPSNEWRGYVLRKIMRRAMRHGKRLGMTGPFLHTLVDVLVRDQGAAYPELVSGRDAIVQAVRSEEERFDAVLTAGLPRLEDSLDRAAASGGTLPGVEAFRLYDTYGLPLDFIEDMAQDRRVAFDREGFEDAMEAQRAKARAGSAFEQKQGDRPFTFASDAARDELANAGDVFEGYTDTTVRGIPVLALFGDDRRQVDVLAAGTHGYVALARTPFYLEAGGQVSDAGLIASESGEIEASVDDVRRIQPGLPRAHHVRVVRGELRPRALVSAVVDRATRDATRRHHTATHLLHAALRQVLGSHVKQAGSLVAPDRLRFDFQHFSAVTPEQILDIERLVNDRILSNTPVQTEVRATEDAIAAGAMALFGEKYGDRVRVVSVHGFSAELCGGTHVAATGDIGLFAITTESGVAAGVRRLEAITGLVAVRAFQDQRRMLGVVGETLNVPPAQAPDKVRALTDEVRRLGRELQHARMKAALGGGGSAGAGEDAQDVDGVKLVAREVSGLDRDALRALVDQHRSRLGSGVVVLACPSDGKVAVVVGVTPDLTGRVPAGKVVKSLAAIVGGGGGGRPDFAEAGGKDPSKVADLLQAAPDVIRHLLGA